MSLDWELRGLRFARHSQTAGRMVKAGS
jgi:hypothetical protein